MISALFLIGLKGEVIVNRFYRDDVSRRAADTFRQHVIASDNQETLPPVKHIDGYSYLHARHQNVYFVTVTRSNTNAALVFRYLSQLNDIFKAYFGKKYSEDTIRGNFTLVYELLDETMDHGYPQNCVIEDLKTYINLGTQTLGRVSSHPNQPKLTKQLTGTVDWRREGIRYKRNEVYLDIFERVNVLVSSIGSILSNDVEGQVMMKTMLTGMPECKLGLNDRLMLQKSTKKKKFSVVGQAASAREVDIEDCSFHRCVQLGQFDADRTITFVPPDGEFELMKYRVSDHINLPFRIIPAYQEQGTTRLSVTLKLTSNFSSRLYATNVKIKIPIPPNAVRTKINVPTGKAKHDTGGHAIVWKIKRFQGKLEKMLDADVTMMKNTKDKLWSRPPIQIEFQVPMFTASGIHVRFLRVVEKDGYSSSKWVRYLTRAGEYQLRT